MNFKWAKRNLCITLNNVGALQFTCNMHNISTNKDNLFKYRFMNVIENCTNIYTFTSVLYMSRHTRIHRGFRTKEVMITIVKNPTLGCFYSIMINCHIGIASFKTHCVHRRERGKLAFLLENNITQNWPLWTPFSAAGLAVILLPRAEHWRPLPAV